MKVVQKKQESKGVRFDSIERGSVFRYANQDYNQELALKVLINEKDFGVWLDGGWSADAEADDMVIVVNVTATED